MVKEVVYRNGGSPTQNQIDWIKRCDLLARNWIRRAEADINAIYSQSKPNRRKKRKSAWKENANFVKYMGKDTVTNEEINDVRRRLDKLHDIFCSKITYRIDAQNKSLPCKQKNKDKSKKNSAWVRVFPMKKNRINLCSNFLEGDEATVYQGAETLIHEAAHFLKVMGMDHNGVGSKSMSAEDKEEALIKLAEKRPRSARKCPDAYAALAQAYRIASD